MSTIVVDELITNLTQEIVVKTQINFAGIKPCLYFGNPSFTKLKLQIIKDSEVLFSLEKDFEYFKGLLGTTDNFIHGFFPFFPESGGSLFLLPGTYLIKISASDYVYSRNNFIGWCKDYLRYFGKINGEIPKDYRMFPYSFKLLEYSTREK